MCIGAPLAVQLATISSAGQDNRKPTSQTAGPEKIVIHQTTIPSNGDDANDSDLQRFRSSRRPHLLSATVDGDHEDAGIITQGEVAAPVYTGAYANHIVYKSGELSLNLPMGATHSQTLFAPTTRPANGACLEVGTAYTTDIVTKATKAALYVFNFCNSAGPDWLIAPDPNTGRPQYPIDDNFVATYTFQNAAGNHEYTISIFCEDTILTASSVWKAQLYNYQAKKWDDIASATGRFLGDPRGWSIFETWYQKGQCSESLHPLGADDLRYFNSTTASWNPVAPLMSVLKNTRDIGGAQNQNCFVDDQTGKASYMLTPQAVTNHWEVTSR